MGRGETPGGYVGVVAEGHLRGGAAGSVVVPRLLRDGARAAGDAAPHGCEHEDQVVHCVMLQLIAAHTWSVRSWKLSVKLQGSLEGTTLSQKRTME